MAYRRGRSKTKSKKRGGTRRRRISGINKNAALLTIGGAVAGYFIAPKVNDFLKSKLGDKIDGKLIALGEVLIGVGLPMMLAKNNKMIKIVGGAIAGMGINEGLKEFGVISGYSDLKMVAGYQDLKRIAGTPEVQRTGSGMSSLQVISGVTECRK